MACQKFGLSVDALQRREFDGKCKITPPKKLVSKNQLASSSKVLVLLLKWNEVLRT